MRRKKTKKMPSLVTRNLKIKRRKMERKTAKKETKKKMVKRMVKRKKIKWIHHLVATRRMALSIKSKWWSKKKMVLL